jgi:hypothetical protein
MQKQERTCTMKKRRIIPCTLALLLIASFTACGGSENGTETEAPTAGESAADSTFSAWEESATTVAATTEPEETPAPAEDSETGPVSKPDSETGAEAGAEAEAETRVPVTDGMMIYHEDFESYGNVSGLDATIEALGWKIQTMADDYAFSDWTADMSIQDGKLYIHNYWDNPEAEDYVVGTDGYVMILDSDYMEGLHEYGDYTLQYDLTYTGAGDQKRYIAIVTEYSGDMYHSFHFRIGGYGNNQTHMFSGWSYVDKTDEGAYTIFAALTANDGTDGVTIAEKLLGITDPITADSINNFADVTVTIRILHDADLGNIVYMKTADMEDFVCVSMPVGDESLGTLNWLNCEEFGSAVCIKTGGQINGYLDNISIWSGLGDMPEDTTVTYTPAPNND